MRNEYSFRRKSLYDNLKNHRIKTDISGLSISESGEVISEANIEKGKILRTQKGKSKA